MGGPPPVPRPVGTEPPVRDAPAAMSTKDTPDPRETYNERVRARQRALVVQSLLCCPDRDANRRR
jgi:hypothetical protein